MTVSKETNSSLLGRRARCGVTNKVVVASATISLGYNHNHKREYRGCWGCHFHYPNDRVTPCRSHHFQDVSFNQGVSLDCFSNRQTTGVRECIWAPLES